MAAIPVSPIKSKKCLNFYDPAIIKQLEEKKSRLLEEFSEAKEKLRKTAQENEDLKKDINLLKEDIEDIKQNQNEILADPLSPNSRKKLEKIAKDVTAYSTCMVSLVAKMLGLLDESDELHKKMDEFQDGIADRYQDENDTISKEIHDQFDELSDKIALAKREFKQTYVKLKELSLQASRYSVKRKLYLSKSAINRLDVIIKMAERVNIK